MLKRPRALSGTITFAGQTNHVIHQTDSSALPCQMDQIDQLRSQIVATERHRNIHHHDRVHSQCAAIDRMLPESGYARGTLTDWIAPMGCAADFLSLSVAHAACQNGGALVVIDPDRQFFPTAAAAMGINMDNLIVLRCAEKSAGHIRAIGQDLLWAIDQSLRCPAVAAVWGPLPKIDDRWQRRFQLSSESSGAMGLFVRPLAVARQPSWSEVQWLVSPGNVIGSNGHQHPPLSQPSVTDCAHDNDFRVRLNLVRCRGTHGGKSISVSINTVTGSVRQARSDRELFQKTGPFTGNPSHSFNRMPTASKSTSSSQSAANRSA